MKAIVGVYGTLRTGGGNHRLLEASNALEQVRIPMGMMVSLGGFPALKAIDGEHMTTLELYEVDEKTLERLDALEGHPHWYHREQRRIEHHDVWVYVMPEAEGAHVETGDWISWRQKQREELYDRAKRA